MLAYFKKNFRYNHWANREVATFLQSLQAPPQKCIQLFAHIVAAEWLWFERLQEMGKRVVVWPDSALNVCADQLPELNSAWIEYLSDLSQSRLELSVPYVNSKEENWSNTVEDVLTHVLLHSAAHRGQIATVLRGADITPPYTDYIHCIRQRLVQ